MGGGDKIRARASPAQPVFLSPKRDVFSATSQLPIFTKFGRHTWIRVKVKVKVWTLVIASGLHESESWPAALYNLGSGSLLRWANGAAAHYVAIHCPDNWTHGAASRHTIAPISYVPTTSPRNMWQGIFENCSVCRSFVLKNLKIEKDQASGAYLTLTTVHAMITLQNDFSYSVLLRKGQMGSFLPVTGLSK